MSTPQAAALKRTCFLVFCGPPGAGKGTQTHLLRKKYGLPSVCAGDLLREESTRNAQVRATLAAGAMVPERFTADLMLAQVRTLNSPRVVLLDGFPRNTVQYRLFARWFDEDVDNCFDRRATSFIVLEASDQCVLERLAHRSIHFASGRSYHPIHWPPKCDMRDDETGEPLVRREDDADPSAVSLRIQNYRHNTVGIYPLLAKDNFRLVHIAQANIQQVTQNVERVLNGMLLEENEMQDQKQ